MSPKDLAEAQALRDAQRAELDWLLARERDHAAPPPSPELADEYAELEKLLWSLPSGPSDKRWQEDVLRAAAALTRSSPRPWRTKALRWMTGGVIAAAAAASVAVWLLPPDAPALEIAVRHTGTSRGDSDEHVVDDRLVVTARPREAGDLRVYRAGRTLVARCPDGPGCTRGAHGAHGPQTIEITLDAPVQYQVILVDGVRITPSDGAMDANAYMEAAQAAGARAIVYRTIDVH